MKPNHLSQTKPNTEMGFFLFFSIIRLSFRFQKLPPLFFVLHFHLLLLFCSFFVIFLFHHHLILFHCYCNFFFLIFFPFLGGVIVFFLKIFSFHVVIDFSSYHFFFLLLFENLKVLCYFFFSIGTTFSSSPCF